MHKKIPYIFTFISDYKKEEILKFNKNIGIIFRNYEKSYDKDVILKTKELCKKKHQKLYLANHAKLAINLDLDGVYIPAFNKNFQSNKYKFKKKFLILGSAHNVSVIKKKEKQGAEVIFISPLFKTKNYKRCLEIIRFNSLSILTDKKIVALGGINKKNLKRLKMTNAYGFSGISYFRK